MLRFSLISLFAFSSAFAASPTGLEHYLQIREKYVIYKAGNQAVDFESNEYKSLDKTAEQDQAALKAELLKYFGDLKTTGFSAKSALYSPSLLAGNTDSYCVDSLLLAAPLAPAAKGVSLRLTDVQLIKNSAQEPTKKRTFSGLKLFARKYLRDFICDDSAHTIVFEIPLLPIKGLDSTYAAITYSSQEGDVKTPNEIVCLGKKGSQIRGYFSQLKGEDILPDEESCKTKFVKCYKSKIGSNKTVTKRLQDICTSQLNPVSI